jgi:hypothetical protein
MSFPQETRRIEGGAAMPQNRRQMKFHEGNKLGRKFQPGQSGNPGGRPKRDLSAEIAQAIFEKNPEAIYQAMLKAIKKGNPKVFSLLADRAYGKAKELVELSANDDLLAALAEGRKRVAADKARQR